MSTICDKINEQKPGSIEIAGIGHTTLDLEQFKEKNYLRGKIYLNINKSLYSNLKFKKFGCCSCFGITCRLIKKGSQLNKQGFKSNLKGDGTLCGGTYVVNKFGEIIFQHKQLEYDDFPDETAITNSVQEYLNNLNN